LNVNIRRPLAWMHTSVGEKFSGALSHAIPRLTADTMAKYCFEGLNSKHPLVALEFDFAGSLVWDFDHR
jgi:hypothetical protein